ncbi:hypothetical protein FRC02_012267 [Tulasnella sp. 418]|nr:hypothetical protein FRC02_012267 [Tulasnella sp. 418]
MLGVISIHSAQKSASAFIQCLRGNVPFASTLFICNIISSKHPILRSTQQVHSQNGTSTSVPQQKTSKRTPTSYSKTKDTPPRESISIYASEKIVIGHAFRPRSDPIRAFPHRIIIPRADHD